MVVGHRYDAVFGAVNDGDRRAPVALAGDAPVLNTEGDGGFAKAFALGMGGHLSACFPAGEAVVRAGVFDDAVVAGGFGHGGGVRQIAAVGPDHGPDINAVFLAEFEVALVVGGDGHDGSGAVTHQNEVADPDGNALTAEGVDGLEAGVEAFFFNVAGALIGAGVDHLFGVRFEGEVERGDDGVPGREDHAGRAVDSVDARGEDADGSEALDVEIDFRALAAADPVALHGEDALGPAAFELGDVFEEFVGVGGGAEEPLFERALFDGGVFVTPAAAIDNLLIGEHGGAFGAPVDEGLFAVGESAFEHAEEEPLVPAIIIGLAGGDFAVPVVGEGEAAVGALHFLNVGEGPFAGRALVGDGGVFGGETEGVPAHGVEDVVAAHPHIAGEGVADGVIADVADMERAAGVGEHLEHVVFGP